MRQLDLLDIIIGVIIGTGASQLIGIVAAQIASTPLKQPSTQRLVLEADKLDGKAFSGFKENPSDTAVCIIVIDGIKYYCTRVGDGICVGPRVPQDAK
jgi:hypothetical protein